MKEIVLVLAYTPTLEKQDKLRNLIISLKSFNYRVCLSTHTPTPQDIIDRCEYFLYDKDNPILWDDDMKYINHLRTHDWNFTFRAPTSFATHGLALWRLYSGALSYLKSLDEEVVHMIEYDTIVKDKDFFNNNTSYLLDSSYTSILYSLPRFHDGVGNLICNWPIQSVNIRKIPFNLLEFNFSELKTQYREYYNTSKYPVIECMFFDNIWNKLDYKLIKLDKESDLSSLIYNTDSVGDGNMEKSTHITFHGGELHFVTENYSPDPKNYTIVTDGAIVDITIPQNTWLFRSLGIKFSNKIRIFKENILIIEYDLSLQKDRDSIFKYTKVTNNFI